MHVYCTHIWRLSSKEDFIKFLTKNELEDGVNFAIIYFFFFIFEIKHFSMYEHWGGIGLNLYIIIPTIIVIMGTLIYVSEIHFLQRHARRKRVRYTLYWILGTYPMGMMCHLIALYIPRSVIYMEFAVDVWVAYAINKLFSLVLMMHGGRRKFTQECFEAKSNAIPCCCLMCLPVVHNNV